MSEDNQPWLVLFEPLIYFSIAENSVYHPDPQTSQLAV